jgi:sulfite reductase (NADPH) hemoprotein beta-component
LGIDAFRDKVNEQWAFLKGNASTLTDAELQRVKNCFTAPAYASINDIDANLSLQAQAQGNKAFANWLSHNTHAHKQPGYKAVTLSLKVLGVAPGDVSDGQLDAIADLADAYSFGEVRNTHQQNMILADVKKADLFALWEKLVELKLATANIGTLTDMICCPGGDFCALANAKSIPVAEQISRKFDDLDYLYDLGPLELNISGCMNACGHHHVGHIGILGVDKKGEEFFQISLGGSQAKDEAALAKILGPSFKADEVADVVEKLINVYVGQRNGDEETFLDCYRRIGIDSFKEAVYA